MEGSSGGHRYLSSVGSSLHGGRFTARYFVTGATGFIGGRVTRQLVDAGDDVVAIARNPENARNLASIGVDVRRVDSTDQDPMRAQKAGADGANDIRGGYYIRT